MMEIVTPLGEDVSIPAARAHEAGRVFDKLGY
jgi:hypothetical protein